MRALFTVLVLAGLAVGCYEKDDGKQAGSGPLYRHHFQGMTQVSQGKNATKLKEIWALKSSAELRQQVLDKLAGAPLQFWRKQLPANATDQKDLIRPLLNDLLANESYVEIRGPSTVAGGGSAGRFALPGAEAVVAVRLPKERLEAWNANLTKVAQAWNLGKPDQVQAGQAKGWEIKRQQDAGILKVMLAGDWALVGMGQEKLTLMPALLEQAGKSGRPVAALAETNLLQLDLDFPRLKAWFPFVAGLKMPPTHFDVIGKGEYVRTEARMKFSESIPWKFEPWKFPTNFIRDPLVSFTVAQGIAPLLPQIKGVAELGLKNYPNQFCSWGLAGHYLVFLSTPMSGSSNLIRQIAPKLPNFLNSHITNFAGQIGTVSNKAEVVLAGVPMVIPFLRSVWDGGNEYLIGGAFPYFKLTNNIAPAELFQQLSGRNNLLYYDWEITQESLVHARQILQTLDIMQRRNLLDEKAPSVRWIEEVRPMLGNTITEVTQAAPNELMLTRKSHVGLTGFELMMLTRWMDSAAFPFNYVPPEGVIHRAEKSANPRPAVPRSSATATNASAPRRR